MKALENKREKQEEFPEMSMRQRSDIRARKRKKQLRLRWIIMNSIIALCIILGVLVVKAISLNRENTRKEAAKEAAAEKKKNTAKQTPVPTATPTPAPVGSERWLRKDLDPSKPMIAMTFDDGPYSPVTEKILDVFEQNNGKATFFCVGSRVAEYASSVQRAYNMGCEIASHTYSHVYLTRLKAKGIKKEQNKTNKAIRNIIGCEPTALRPPGGFVNAKVRKNMKVPMICWSVDSEDWKSRNTKKVLKRCKKLEDGDIVLMHDLYPTTAKAVKKLVPRLVKQGFQLVTVDELFYYKGIPIKAGELHFSGK